MRERTPVRIFLFVLGAVCLCICAFGISHFLRPKIPELAPNSTIELRANGNQRNFLRFQIGSNQFFQISIPDPQKEVSVTLSGPNRLNRSTGCVWGGARISETTTRAASYTIEVRSCDAHSEGEYQVSLRQVRKVVDADHTRVEAERAAEEAGRLLRDRPRRVEEALAQSKKALDLWLTTNDVVAQARTFMDIGILYKDTGRSDDALKTLMQGVQIADSEHLETERAAIRRAIASVFSGEGKEVEQVAEYASKALQISQMNSLDRSGEAEGWIVQGDAQYLRGHADLAAAAYEKAFDLFITLGYRRGQARALWYWAIADLDNKDFTQALDRASRARALFDELKDDIGGARSSIVIGQALDSTSHQQEALDLFESARATLKQAGDLAAEATVLMSIAQIHLDLHHCETALPYTKLAMEEFKKTGNQGAESTLLQFEGYCYYELEDFTSARLLMNQASQGFEHLQDGKRQAFCLRDLALVQMASGEEVAAEKNWNNVLQKNLAFKDPLLEATARLALGRIREKKNVSAARLLYQQALDLYRGSQNRLGEVSALYYIARSQQRNGQIMEAVARSEEAIRIIEELRTSLASSALQTNFFASAQQHFDLYIDALMHMPGGASGTYASKALEASERARARNLLDSIGETRVSISQHLDKELAAREASLRAKIDAKLEQLLNATPGTKDQKDLSDELSTMKADADVLQSQLRKQDPRYSALVKPHPLTLSEIQKKVLDSDSILLEFALGEENSYLFFVTNDYFTSVQLPRRSIIENKVMGLHNLVIARSISPEDKDYQARVQKADKDYPAAAAELSEILLGQVANRLGKHRLVIVADGALQYLPFPALPTPQSGKTSSPISLLVDHEFGSLPSASTLAVIRQEATHRPPADRTIAVFADPVFELTDERVPKTQRISAVLPAKADPTPMRSASLESTVFRSGRTLPRLPASAQEARFILNLVTDPKLRLEKLGFDATRDAALDNELRHYKYLHFATHAMLIDEHPELSSLMLSQVDKQGNRRNGSLRLQDIYNLRLSADLVVLSACETALGKEVKGEGLMSMVRGFMYSGTPRVLASLWKVDDDATADLMSAFYEQLLKSSLPPAKALRQAQLMQMRRRTKNQPFYWAAFQLQGEWN